MFKLEKKRNTGTISHTVLLRHLTSYLSVLPAWLVYLWYGEIYQKVFCSAVPGCFFSA